MCDNDLLNTYIKTFCGKDMFMPLPGEHHFVALCLVPILMKKISMDKIKYINPDGMKSLKNGTLFDISVKDEKNVIRGIEIKYSENSKIKIRGGQYLSLEKSSELMGITALVNVKGSSKFLFISREEFFKKNKISGVVKNKKYYPFDVEENNKGWIELKNDSDFHNLFSEKK